MYLKSVARSGLIALLFGLCAAILGYLFRLILARNLSVDEYGLFYAMLSFFAFFTTFVDLGLVQSTSRKIVEFSVKKNYDKIKGSVLSSFFLQVIMSLILALIFLVLMKTDYLTNYFKTDNTVLFILLLIWFMTLPLDMLIQSIMIGFQKVRVFSSIGMIKNALMILATLSFLFLGFNVAAPFIAYALMNFLIFIIFLPYVWKLFPFNAFFSWDWKLVKQLVTYGGFIVFSGFAWSIITYSDTMMILFFRDNVEVGFYQVALPLAYTLTYFMGALNSVVYPLFTKLDAEKNTEKIIQGITLLYKYCFAVLIPFALIMLSFPDLVIQFLFGDKFIPASTALRVLIIGTLFFSLASFNINIFLATGKARTIAKMAALIAVINIILNLILAPKYGFIGVSIATTLSFAILCLITMVKLRKIYEFKIPLLNWAFNFLIGGAIILFIYYAKKVVNLNVWIELTIVLASSAIIYLILLLMFRIVRIEELKKLLTTVLRS